MRTDVSRKRQLNGADAQLKVIPSGTAGSSVSTASAPTTFAFCQTILPKDKSECWLSPTTSVVDQTSGMSARPAEADGGGGPPKKRE